MSDDKKLLSENTVRRFMTLANVGALSNNFVNEKFTKEEVNEEEEEVNEEKEEVATEGLDAAYARDDEELPPDVEPEEDVEMDMDMGEMEPEAEVDAEAGTADISLTEEEARLLVDLGVRLGEVLGPAEEEAAEEEPLDMAPEEEEVPAAEVAPEEEEEPVLQEALIREVLKRVTKRIVSEKLKNRK